jgi:hypothetical protein
MIRAAAIITGILLIGASAHALIVSQGGYEQTSAVTTLALAAGIIVGSICIGTNAQRGLAWGIALAMLAGEGYALLGTADRIVTMRETQQAPLREATARNAEARGRLDTAERNHKAAVDASREKAAEKGCAKNCAALLQSAIDNAAREVTDARMALSDAPLPASPSPLADRLGIAPWALDLLVAALLSVGLNGLAAVLIAFGAHAPKPAEQKPANTITGFMLDRIDREPKSRVEVTALYSAYVDWCRAKGVSALPVATFADALVPVLEAAGIKRRAHGDDVFLVDVKLAS